MLETEMPRCWLGALSISTRFFPRRC